MRPLTIFKRNHSPLSRDTWTVLDDEARQVLLKKVVARTLGTVLGPHGHDCAGINLGTLAPGVLNGGSGGDVQWGRRRVLPLTEFKVPFKLPNQTLDDLERGAADPDLSPLQEAAAKAAHFEDTAVFYGLEGTDILGMARSSTHEPIALPPELTELPATIASAKVRLIQAGFPGPFKLLLGSDLYRSISGENDGFPMLMHLTELVGHPPILADAIRGAFLVSPDDADLKIDLGFDFMLAYSHCDAEHAHFHITESFAVRIGEPMAIQISQ